MHQAGDRCVVRWLVGAESQGAGWVDFRCSWVGTVVGWDLGFPGMFPVCERGGEVSLK